MQHTAPKSRLDVNARLDVESLTEIFDNEEYSEVGSLGRLVYELLLELVLCSPSLALELTSIVKDRAFRRAHLWPLDGVQASRAILKDTQSVALDAIIELTSSDIVHVTPDSENALWAEAIAGLDNLERIVTLLFTTNLKDDGKEAKPLDAEMIATKLSLSIDAVERLKKSASQKIQSFLLNRMNRTSTGGN